jgi:hypothetical protein
LTAVNALFSTCRRTSNFRPSISTATRSSRFCRSSHLDLRYRVGPIGGYLQQLYRQRRGQEIERFTADMTRHGVITSSQFHQSDRLRNLAFERAFDLMTKQADERRFMLFPLGILTGTSGILAALKAKGATVVPRA